MVLKQKIEGIITALLTPFTKEGNIDEEALRELVEFQVKSGIHGLYPCGTVGEGPTMSIEQRKQVAEIVVDQVKGRIPVIVHVGAINTTMTVELAEHAEKIGADAIGCVTPYYYTLDDEAIIEHYKQVANAVHIPIFIYNIPHRTTINITPDLMVKLAKLPNVVGVKDSSRNFIQLCEYIEKLGENFSIICGSDAYVIPALFMGAKGSISAISNVFPELFTESYNAYKKADYQKAVRLQRKINAVRRALEKPTIIVLKEALRMRGFKAGTVKNPLRPMTEKEIAKLRDSLKELGLIKS
jgi:4-hydroxy-tetrahydrodipicolinate synthase